MGFAIVADLAAAPGPSNERRQHISLTAHTWCNEHTGSIMDGNMGKERADVKLKP